MKLPEILNKVKKQIEECRNILLENKKLWKEIEQLKNSNEALNREIISLRQFLFYILFADFKGVSTSTFKIRVDEERQRAVFVDMSSYLYDLCERSLPEFLEEVVKRLKEALDKEHSTLQKGLERVKKEHQKLKETYDLLKGLKAFIETKSR